jgi:hypothetical protein
MNQKRLGPLKKPLRMTNMCFASLKLKSLSSNRDFSGIKIYRRYLYKLICMSVIHLTDSNIRKEG